MDELIRIDFDEIVKETDRAFQILIDNKNFWLPKSQINMYEKPKAVHVPEWLAKDKGLI